MPFKKGQVTNPEGRKRGSQNKDKVYKERQIYEAVIGSLKTGKYYVYCHYNLQTEEVFYIGKGKHDRAWAMGDAVRNGRWLNYTQALNNHFGVKIIAANLSEDEALAVEAALIKIDNPVCNIHQTVFNFNMS